MRILPRILNMARLGPSTDREFSRAIQGLLRHSLSTSANRLLDQPDVPQCAQVHSLPKDLHLGAVGGAELRCLTLEQATDGWGLGTRGFAAREPGPRRVSILVTSIPGANWSLRQSVQQVQALLAFALAGTMRGESAWVKIGSTLTGVLQEAHAGALVQFRWSVELAHAMSQMPATVFATEPLGQASQDDTRTHSCCSLPAVRALGEIRHHQHREYLRGDVLHRRKAGRTDAP